MQWPSPDILRRESKLLMGRRRALNIYDTKDIVFTHQQMKKEKKIDGSSKRIYPFG